MTAPEARLEEVAADAAATRHLAAGADRDVSEARGEPRAHTRALSALSALRETQVEQGQAIERGFSDVPSRLDQTAGGTEQIVGLLNTLITKTTASSHAAR